MAYFAVHGSSSRWFWAVWKENTGTTPDRTGYADSKEEAMENALTVAGKDAEQKTSDFAKQWRGICACKHCDSTNLETGNGKGKHFASLHCRNCRSFLKWLSLEQFDQFNQSIAAGAKK